ncbi:MAG: signal peptidase I [Coriobacteriales bacterium]|jgi:signal peptidase I|nr:signal peptidase I [Coriobacteriales bacterium]
MSEPQHGRQAEVDSSAPDTRANAESSEKPSNVSVQSVSADNNQINTEAEDSQSSENSLASDASAKAVYKPSWSTSSGHTPDPRERRLAYDDPKNRRLARSPLERRKRSVFQEILSFVTTIAVVVCLTAALKLFIIDVYTVPTGSMSPTIAIDDHIIAEKITRLFSPIEQSDIVTFIDPNHGDRILVKRVIAVGGQTVDLRGGIVYVDGVALDEPYTYGRPSHALNTMPGVEISYPYLVPEGSIWVMGDNRTDSLDSRYFGPISEKQVTGKSFLVLWPLNHFGNLE